MRNRYMLDELRDEVSFGYYGMFALDGDIAAQVFERAFDPWQPSTAESERRINTAWRNWQETLNI